MVHGHASPATPDEHEELQQHARWLNTLNDSQMVSQYLEAKHGEGAGELIDIQSARAIRIQHIKALPDLVSLLLCQPAYWERETVLQKPFASVCP